jgi:hypothetical protein
MYHQATFPGGKVKEILSRTQDPKEYFVDWGKKALIDGLFYWDRPMAGNGTLSPQLISRPHLAYRHSSSIDRG